MRLQDVARNQAVGTISNIFKKVSGNLPGRSVGRGGSSHDTAAMQQKSNFTTTNLVYPMNVEGDPMQGHYIMFMINEADSATLHAEKAGMTAKSVAKKLAREANIPVGGQAGHGEGMDFLAGQGGNPGHNEFGGMSTVVEKNQIEHFKSDVQKKKSGQSTHSLALKKHSTTRLDTAISLYMPPSVSVSYGINYKDAEVGVMAETGSKVINDLLQAKDFSVGALSAAGKKALGSAGSGALQWGKEAGIKALDTFAPGAETLIALERGAIITPRMELMIEGVSRRSFSYKFDFIPKSAQEALIVEDIIYAFKFHMHPEYVKNAVAGTGKESSKIASKAGISGVGREMTIPSTFDIVYMHQKKSNAFLNKISTCFLKSMDVQYGGDRFTAYESTKGNFGSGPPPQRTSITLNFSEMEIITKERIAEGF
jgi:hypothetical protein